MRLFPFLFFMLFATSVRAESAEDMVIFLLTGSEGTETTAYNKGSGQETTVIPVTADGRAAKLVRKEDGKIVYERTVSVKRVDDCKYLTSISETTSDGRRTDGRMIIDFSGATSTRSNLNESAIFFRGLRLICEKGGDECGNVSGAPEQMGWATAAKPFLVEGIYQRFRQRFCPGY
ncbi:hypothetical protein ELG64_08955 [Rhizobium leguminosarum]|uniref:hypothetical protein n=1 Tax=Rhizobium leguminosarum TaxID=384 RepID=UPI001031090F|nr:hypothetical protein [Rhizobium leguminosarum]TBH23622.1 hypothetical protein ELG64_08955 [Rhizobium leguminosarum]